MTVTKGTDCINTTTAAATETTSNTAYPPVANLDDAAAAADLPASRIWRRRACNGWMCPSLRRANISTSCWTWRIVLYSFGGRGAKGNGGVRTGACGGGGSAGAGEGGSSRGTS
ncbi:hypothetical protein Vafri_15411 [Volvox africanus]|uniref:Uncharacterized protein n=1 Tax=Volvox africanus TaxID=51714 RepID=A0A8J4F7Z9_9CHLO|nr:hypothetical protein Vafri_15411 [Volvox africanus]